MISPKSGFLRIVTILLALALVVLVVINLKFGFLSKKRIEPSLPTYGQISGAQLLDSNGKPFSKSDMIGRVWVANFIFTRCPSMCPTMSLKFQLLSKTLSQDIGFLSFTVDPEFDTPEVLAAYAQKYSADTKRWHFLTGNKEALDQMIRSCHIGVEDDPNMHSLRFVLIDDKAQIRGYYDSTDANVLQKIREDVSRLP